MVAMMAAQTVDYWDLVMIVVMVWKKAGSRAASWVDWMAD